jgi:ketosteroid isomerase-like protein
MEGAAESPGLAGTIERLRDATNEHDIEALVACFDPYVRSEQPAHPSRDFVGTDQIRANWSQIFHGVPDIHAELVTSTVDASRGCAEWAWNGTRADGAPFEMRGVTILTGDRGRIASVRFYMEPVQRDGVQVGTAVQQVVGTS